MEKLLNSREAAKFLRVNIKTLQRLARSGDIRGMKIGKLWRFRTEDLVVGPGSKKNREENRVGNRRRRKQNRSNNGKP
jgi:excisionase family DNA binding protein